jgi:hypothetical protein
VNNSAGCAAAFYLNFRNDYNPDNKSFTNAQNPFSRQIIITPWASGGYIAETGSKIGEFDYYGVKWIV